MSTEIDLGEIVDVVVDEHTGKVKKDGYKRTGRRLLVPRSLFGHMHIRGMTGSGKTSLGVEGLARQFIEPYEITLADGSKQRIVEPIFIFDLGGDQNLFWNVHDAVEELGRRTGVQRDFRYLTLDNHLHSFFFPPFQAVDADVNALTIAQLFIVAFSMDHGLVYGGNYYSQMNLAALHRVARKVTSETGNATLEDVARYLDDPASRLKDAEQVRMTFEFCSSMNSSPMVQAMLRKF